MKTLTCSRDILKGEGWFPWNHWTKILKQISILLFILAPQIRLLVLVITDFRIPEQNWLKEYYTGENFHLELFYTQNKLCTIVWSESVLYISLHVKKYLGWPTAISGGWSCISYTTSMLKSMFCRMKSQRNFLRNSLYPFILTDLV